MRIKHLNAREVKNLHIGNRIGTNEISPEFPNGENIAWDVRFIRFHEIASRVEIEYGVFGERSFVSIDSIYVK